MTDTAEGRAEQARRPPVDPRLLRYSPSARRYALALAGFAIIDAIAVIAGAAALAGLLAELITDPAARSFEAQGWHLAVVAASFAVRAGMTYLRDRYAHRAALATIAELRSAAVNALTDPARTPPHQLVAERDHAATVILRGLDALIDYLADYVPALASTFVITPLVIVVVAIVDWPSALVIVITMPLIPVFMILIGLLTRDRTRRKLDAMSRQSSQLLDLLTGLPTLKALGRSRGPAARVDQLGADLQRTTMSSLRIAFLSGAVLELLATLCVAMVAVSIGVRLVHGDMALYAGVLALVLAPEAYLPLRRIGSAFHAAEDGMEAAREILDVIARAPQPHGSRHLDLRGKSVTFVDLGIRGRDGWTPRGLNGRCEPGEITVLTGPNGSGKSTALAAILGLERPDEGNILLGDVPVTDLAAESLHAQVAWLPQHPVIVAGTVADNLALFGDLDPALVDRMAAVVGLDGVLADLPAGPDTRLGPGGTGLSAGQRQRIAVVRTLARRAPLVVLDEPTAHLDDDTAASVLDAIAQTAAEGATVVLVAHRDDLTDGRMRVLTVAGEATR